MAHSGTGEGWDTTAPANSDARKDGAKEIRDLRIGIGDRVGKEHVHPVASATSSDANAGGEHKAGSAMFYYGAGAPTKRPDGVTNLNASDQGRMWVNGGTVKYWDGAAWQTISGATSYSVAMVYDSLGAGTAGGSIAAGSWVTRPLNTELDPSGIVSIAANQFTLAAGTYEVQAHCQIFAGDAHQARLYNVTDSTTQALGTTEFASSSSPFGESSSEVSTVFTIAGTKAFRLEHRVTTNGQFGKAPASSFGVNTIYTLATIRKLA
jgi:hypothetical protein